MVDDVLPPEGLAATGGVAAPSNVLTPAATDDDLHLLFNGFTGALLELSPDETAAVRPWIAAAGTAAPAGLDARLRASLQEGGFVVPRDFHQLAALRRLRRTRADTHLSLTIAPTMQCNFRCTYCFEEHRQQRIGPETEAQLLRLVARQLPEVRQVSTTWFGGEPLLEMELLERVQRRVDAMAAAAEVSLSRALVTNGYLLSGRTVDRLAALGSWRHFQVTIDGSAVIHDGRRMLRGGQGTWTRIVAGTRRALDVGLPVSVRVNVDRRNANDLERLLDDLLEATVLPRARIYLGQVSDSTQTCAHVESYVLGRKAFARTRLRFQAALLQRGLPTSIRLPKPLCHNLRIADNPRGYVVGPSGLLFKCWNQIHMGPEVAVGHLDGQELPEATRNRAHWASYAPLDKPGCQTCFALPTCMGGCPWEAMRLDSDIGSCGDFRFYPEETVQLAHLGMVERALTRGGAEPEREPGAPHGGLDRP